FRSDGALDRLDIAERHLVEALDRGAETLEVFLVAGRRDRRQRAAVEGALERNDAIAFRLAVGRLVLTRDLDRAFNRLGAGILEEHGVSEGRRAQPVGQPLAFRNAVQIRDVPELLRLL